MDGPAVLATPSLDIKSSNDLDDLVLELDEADINGPDSSTDGNDSKDDMKVQDSPPLKKTVSSLSDEPSSECEDPGISENSSMDIQEGVVNTETHSIILISEPNLEHSEHINSIEKEISKATVEAESLENSESNSLNRVNLEVEKPAVSSSDKPEVSESLTKMGGDNYESVDQELDDLLNIEDGDGQSSSNVDIKSENEESDNETSKNINAVGISSKVFEVDDIVIKSEEMIDDVIPDDNVTLSVEKTIPLQIKKIESVEEEPMEVSLDEIKMEDSEEPVEGDTAQLKDEDLDKTLKLDLDEQTEDLEKPTEEVSEKPTEDVSEKPTEDVSDKPTEDLSEKPTEDISEKLTEDVSDKPTEDLSEKPTEDISEKLTEDVSEKPTEEVSEKPTEDISEKPAEDVSENVIVDDSEKLINEDLEIPKENGLKEQKEKGLAVQVDENAEEELVEGMEGRKVDRNKEKSLKKQSKKKGLEKGVKQNLKKIKKKSSSKEKEEILDEPMDEDFSMDGGDSLDSDDFLGGCSDEPSKDSTNSISHETESAKVIKRKGKNKRLAERDFNDTPKKKRLTEDEVDKMVNDVVEKALKTKRVNGFKKGVESDYSSDESVIEVNENKGKKKKLKNSSMVTSKTKSIERPDVYLAAREKLAAVKDLNSRPLTLDGNMMEEMVMMKVVEYLAIGEQNEHRMDYASLMKKCSFLENALLQSHKKSQDLTKQVEDCKHIIKKLIEERVANKPCLAHTMPLRVTRSVGLQVCTVGSVNMVNSRSKDLESVKKLLAASNSTMVGLEEEEEDAKEDLVVVDDEDELDDKEDADKGPSEKRVSDGERTQVTSSKSASQGRTSSTAIKLPTLLPKPFKNASTPDSSSARKDSSPGVKVPPKVSACIDLTDNDDVPEKPENEIPKSSQPKPSQPKPSQTTPSQPKPSQTTPSQPKPSQTTPSQPMPSQPKSSLPSAGSAARPPRPPSNSAEKLNGETKTPSEKLSIPSKMARKSTTGGINKKVSPAGADLVSSYEHLPKLPPSPKYGPDVSRPPKPILRIGKNNSGKQGIMLSWNFDVNKNPKDVEEYQLFAFQETKSNHDKNKNPDTWKKVGDIKALPLPMACFLTQFVEGHKYHFIVRAVDKEKKVGEFSMPGSIILQSAGNLQTSTST